MSDYKDAIQAIFEEMCFDEFGTEFWDLSDDVQATLYTKAEREYADRMADRADYLRKREREEGLR